MPRKSASTSKKVIDTVDTVDTVDTSKEVEMIVNDSDESGTDSAMIDGVEVVTRAAPKARKSVVDKIDQVLQLIEQGASVSVITKHLQSVRKTLDGAQIKSTKKTRKPNSYNIFMSEEMEKLRESTMPATEKFKHCINLWNERKIVNSTNIEIAVGCA